MKDNRKLASGEQAMEILNRQAASFQVVTISQITGPLSEDILRQALDLIQYRHPRLNSRIVGELDNLYFEGGAIKIPLRIVNNLHKEQWQEVVLEEMNQKIESQKGLARFVLVRCQSQNNVSYLIATLHHAISDGLSCIRLHSEILTYCQKIVSGEPVGKVETLPPLPPIQQLLPKVMQGFPGVISSIFTLLRLKLWQIWHRPKSISFEKYVPTELRHASLVHRQLKGDVTQQLVNCCRNEKTTVQGALCAALMFAAAKKITGNQSTDVHLTCRSSISLRKRLQPEISDENLGLLASSLTSFHILRQNTSFWDLARDVRKQLEAGLEGNDIFSMALMTRKIVESFLKHPNQAPVTVAITNIGRVNIPPVYSPFILKEISFVVAQAAFGGIVSAAVSTFQDKMLLNFMFSEPSISRDTMEELANNAISYLVNACNQKKEAST